jgi:MFS transporter, PAT family, beta-lactamase induction signal transducer AmpG
VGAWESLRGIARSWRLASVSLLSFSSGLPLGLVWYAIPAWMTTIGVDIKVVGLFTLAQAPWTFKVLWAPLMDRYVMPFLGRKRGWILVTQAGLLAATLWLAASADSPARHVALIGFVTLVIAFVAASQDVAVDAYAVEALRPEEQGAAVGARVGLYRAAMVLAGTLAITLAAPQWLGSWKIVLFAIALCFVPMLLVTVRAPEPEGIPPPPQTLREAVWEPFVGFLGQHRALEILAFVLLFKASDNLTQALTRPFLIQMGFSGTDVGIGSGLAEFASVFAGTLVGGLLTTALGLGRTLWITGFLQIFSNLGYVAVAQVGPDVRVMYGAVVFEMITSGMGTGAFSVLLLRLTEKRFSATQYALLSSLFALPRILAGPVAGILADKMGWRDFFLFTVLTGVPGLIMLWRFVPWGVHDPQFRVAPGGPADAPVPRRAVWVRGILGSLLGFASGILVAALLEAIRAYRRSGHFDLSGPLASVLSPQGIAAWTTLLGSALFGLAIGLFAAAMLVARRRTGAVPLE